MLEVWEERIKFRKEFRKNNILKFWDGEISKYSTFDYSVIRLFEKKIRKGIQIKDAYHQTFLLTSFLFY